MLFVGNNILHVPGDSFAESLLADLAVRFDADGATVRNAIILMNKKFYC